MNLTFCLHRRETVDWRLKVGHDLGLIIMVMSVFGSHLSCGNTQNYRQHLSARISPFGWKQVITYFVLRYLWSWYTAVAYYETMA